MKKRRTFRQIFRAPVSAVIAREVFVSLRGTDSDFAPEEIVRLNHLDTLLRTIAKGRVEECSAALVILASGFCDVFEKVPPDQTARAPWSRREVGYRTKECA